MKSQRFFFSVVAVAAILGVLFVCFGIVKPRFQSAVRGVTDIQVAEVVRVVDVGNLVAVSTVKAVATDVSVMEVGIVDHPVNPVDIVV